MKIFHFLLFFVFLNTGCSHVKVKTEDTYVRFHKLIGKQFDDIDKITNLANKVANRVISGGGIWLAGNQGMVGEFSYRSGGLMMIRRLYRESVSKKDTILFFHDNKNTISNEWKKSKALIINIGNKGKREDSLRDYSDMYLLPRHIAQTSLSNFFMAELIASFTRKGKMPVLFETIGRYEGHTRIKKYELGKIRFHEKHNVRAIEEKKLSKDYFDNTLNSLSILRNKSENSLKRLVDLINKAKNKQGSIYLYHMGHMYPDFFKKNTPSHWIKSSYYAGFTSATLPKHTYKNNDLIIYFGTHYAPDKLLSSLSSVNTSVFYFSLMRSRKFPKMKNTHWHDPSYSWFEAETEIDGYDVPALTSSGLVNTLLMERVNELMRKK
jgi:hypothetical protein